jgi:hypothetical protein
MERSGMPYSTRSFSKYWPKKAPAEAKQMMDR